MRRDVYIRNDSGGFSVVAADAATDIVEDERADDLRFVNGRQAMLLSLQGDDSMPVRLVVDEPLSPEESAEWLARVAGTLDAPDGRILVMGGFDPDVLSDWVDGSAPDDDTDSVAVVPVTPGRHRVDVYAHVGSMNGRHVLASGDAGVGARFRASRPGAPFPAWLVRQLSYSGEGDPGHEALWSDPQASVASGDLRLDEERVSVVGFLVHVTPDDGAEHEVPADGWFDPDAGARTPDVFPLGLPAEVTDPGLQSLVDELLGRSAEPDAPTVAKAVAPVIDGWAGDPPTPLDGGPLALSVQESYLLYWIAGLGSDGAPRYELRVTVAGDYAAPTSTELFAVLPAADGALAIGAPPDSRGWMNWWSVKAAVEALGDLPEGTTLDLAIARESGDDPAVGRARYLCTVRGGRLAIDAASPAVPRARLEAALAFVRELAGPGRIPIRDDADRVAVVEAIGFTLDDPESLLWDEGGVALPEPDERTLLMGAEPVFRRRFADTWAMSLPDD